MSIYVEATIRGRIDELRRLTQTPELHSRWDLRFTNIVYLPRCDKTQPQRFRYSTRIGFGLKIDGEGETVGEKENSDGQRTSALKFWSDSRISLIREGAGYWRYVPIGDRIRFFTSYDYRVRYGVLGRGIDFLVFRPLLGWATAWSFDRLRLWIEKGIDPSIALRQSLIHAVARLAIAFVWIYQGAVPKLIARNADELLLIQNAGISQAIAPLALQVIGWSEVAFGLAMLLFFCQRWHFLLTILLMLLATFSVGINSPTFLARAFNPVVLNLSMVVMAAVGWLSSLNLPSARHCLRKPPTGGA